MLTVLCLCSPNEIRFIRANNVPRRNCLPFLRKIQRFESDIVCGFDSPRSWNGFNWIITSE